MVVLYTTHCPKCIVLETKLKQKNIDYQTVEDTQLMIDKGFTEIPTIEVDNNIMNFKEAINWLSVQE